MRRAESFFFYCHGLRSVFCLSSGVSGKQKEELHVTREYSSIY
jgi:hypothetical protein